MALDRVSFALFAFVSCLTASAALAHGEDKPGPHGGFVRMPGTFHAEIVPIGNGSSIDVYLLDLSNANATIQLSKVSLKLETKTATANVECKEGGDHFTCDLPAGTKLSEGEITLTAKRLGAQGSPAVYSLPLGFGHAAH